MTTMFSNQRVCRQSSKSLFHGSLNSLFINAAEILESNDIWSMENY